MIYLVASNVGYWGKGSTKEEAIKNANIAKGHDYIALAFDTDNGDGIYVDELGRWHAPMSPVVSDVQPITAKSRKG